MAVLAALRFVPESRGGLLHRTFDFAGATSVAGGLVLLTYTLVNAQAGVGGSGRTVGPFIASALLLAGFILIEARSRFPLIRLSIFRIRPLAVADMSFFLTAFLTSPGSTFKKSSATARASQDCRFCR